MKVIKFSLAALCCLISMYSFGNSDKNSNPNQTENTPDSTLFAQYLDTIVKYTYIDNQKVKEHFKKCDELLSKDIIISDKMKLKHVTYSVYDQLWAEKYLESFQILKNNMKLLDGDQITTKEKNNYKYLEAYTQMTLGDFEFAQSAYYELLNNGQQNKDTTTIIQALYSLGQLHSLQKDYINAEKYYLEEYNYENQMSKEGGRNCQILVELVNMYVESKQWEKAKKYNEIGLQLADKYKVKDLKISFLRFKGEIALQFPNIFAAEQAYDEATKLSYDINDATSVKYNQTLRAKILSAKGNHTEALGIWKNLIKQEKSLIANMDWHQYAAETCNKMGEYQQAYYFATQLNQLQDSIHHQKKMQQTQYLTIKFDADEKSKANQILEAAILQKQTQNNFLYTLASVFLLLMTIFFGAFYQKKKYSNRLKDEVNERTKELETTNILLQKSNKQMDEFNRILSHDLKEPLRSIVGFSTLAKRKLGADSAAGEYLSIIANSGKQLNQLIEDVSIFQRVGDFSEISADHVDSNEILSSIIASIKILINKKNVKIHYNDLPTVYAHQSFLFLVFKNLIENGIKYNQSEEPSIQIRYKENNNTHYFEIEDNGIGISKEFHEKVFGMFKRLNDRKTYEGTGLGLAMARKMMHKMKGEISVLYSEEGKGSIFQVTFPNIAEKVPQNNKRKVASTV